jgi:hypothetical protein
MKEKSYSLEVIYLFFLVTYFKKLCLLLIPGSGTELLKLLEYLEQSEQLWLLSFDPLSGV